jgi:hypothetical protein
MTTASRQPTLRSQAHCKAHKATAQKPTLQRACLHPRCPSYISLLIICLLALGLTSTYGQTPNSLTTFNRPTLSQLIQLPSTPQPATFQQIDITHFSKPTNQQTQLYSTNPILGGQNPIEQQNKRIMQSAGMPMGATNAQQVQALAEVERDLMEEKFYKDHLEWMEKTKSYQQAFKTLSGFNPDSFSISKAVFTVENAFFGNKYNYESFENALKQRAELVKQILKRENLNTKNNTALNYGIMKLYQQNNNYYDKKTKQSYSVKPFRYDFEDFRGEKDYTKMFTIKMLSTGKGQCHSMPLNYLMIAEQLGAKAYLSLAPQHSFIQFADNNNNMMSFETTNGNLVSPNWLQQSGFVNANALKSKTYLDTLSQRNLYAQCLADLLLGYMDKFGYDDFAEAMRQKILQTNPNNTTANVIDANIKTQIALQKINAAGKPKEKDLPNFPEAYQAYLNMQAAYDKVDGLGYQDMPKEAYKKWLKSIDQAKKKQENKEVLEKLQREIEYLKKLKPVLLKSVRD